MVSFPIVSLGFFAARVDVQKYLLPNKYTLNILLMGLILQFVYAQSHLFVFALSVALFHVALGLILPTGIGMGDIKFISGLVMTLPSTQAIWNWLILLYGFGLVHGFFLKIRQKSSRIPFGPSIYGAWVLIYMGELAHVAMDYSG